MTLFHYLCTRQWKVPEVITDPLLLSRQKSPINNSTGLARSPLRMSHTNKVPSKPEKAVSLFCSKRAKEVLSAHGSIITSGFSIFNYTLNTGRSSYTETVINSLFFLSFIFTFLKGLYFCSPKIKHIQRIYCDNASPEEYCKIHTSF